MDRFFADDLAERGARVVLSPDETRHVKVRRVSPGEEATLFDGAGRRARARLVSFEKKCAVFDVMEIQTAGPEVEPLVTVATAVPKGPRMADLLRACTEVGVWKILPMITERSVARPDEGRLNDRWVRIAREAAKQSRRFHAPEVLPVAGFNEVLATVEDFDVTLIAETRRGAVPLREVLKDKQGAGTALVLVGPEGGFTDAEVEKATSRGFVAARFPGPVMRVETAAPVLAAMVIFACT